VVGLQANVRTYADLNGTKLIAKIISHALNIDQYGEWNGMGWSDKGMHKVCHRSLPFLIPPQYPDIEKWIHENRHVYDVFFVITTRDIIDGNRKSLTSR